MTLILVFVALGFLIFLGVPIAIALGTVGVAGLYLERGALALYDVPLKLYEGSTSFPLIAIPLFVLAGALMNTAGISKRLIAFTSALVGFVRGGLAMVNVGVSLFFAEISGSAVADVAAIGSVLIPAMKKRGYKASFTAAVTSSSASLAIIIPPSIPMILYGSIADASIVQLFVAGIVPGLIGGFSMMALCWWFAVRYNLPREEAFSLRKLAQAFKESVWALSLPIIILGGIFGGIVTATEGCWPCRVGESGYWHIHLSRTGSSQLPPRSCGRRHSDWRRDDAGCQFGRSRTLFNPNPCTPSACCKHHRIYRRPNDSIDAAKCTALFFRNVSTWRCSHHSGCTHRHAAGSPSRDRSNPFRPDRYPQSRYRPADPAGRKRPCDLMFDCQNRHLGNHKNQSSLYRFAANNPLVGDLCPGSAPKLSGVLLRMTKPLIAIVPGDPAGIGPELLVKLLNDPRTHETVDIVVVGDRHVIARGEAATGISLNLERVDEPGSVSGDGIAYLATDTISAQDIQTGEVCADCGRSCIQLLGQCLDLAQNKTIDGFMFCPMNKASLHAAKLGTEDEMQWIKKYLEFDGDCGEINALDGLWTSRVTSHVPLREVAGRIDGVSIERAIRLLVTSLKSAGIFEPKVSVCGLNPHAGDGGNIGSEEIDIIAPAVQAANAAGYPCDGPWPADTIFVRASRGGTDGIVTMYHDQGQIAMKLMGFERGVTILGGLPVKITTPAHGTAFDIAGQGVADVRATRAALSTLLALTSS